MSNFLTQKIYQITFQKNIFMFFKVGVFPSPRVGGTLGQNH